MGKPFNDEPVETLVEKLFSRECTVLDLRLFYIGDSCLDFIAKC